MRPPLDEAVEDTVDEACGVLGTVPLGDFDGIIQRFWKICEGLSHLLSGFEIMLRRQPAAILFDHIAPFGDTNQGVMRLVVLRLREKDLVGSDQRQLQVICQIKKLRLHDAFRVRAVPL